MPEGEDQMRTTLDMGAEQAGRRKPSCMREHLDFIQEELNRVDEAIGVQDERLRRLEDLIG